MHLVDSTMFRLLTPRRILNLLQGYKRKAGEIPPAH